MKKMRVSTSAFILILLFSALANEQFVQLAKANPFHEIRADSTPVIDVHSPMNNTCVNCALVNFTVTKPEYWVDTPESLGYAQQLQSVRYEIYGEFDGAVGVNTNSTFLGSVSYIINGKFFASIGLNSNLSSPVNYCAYLTNLTDGAHNLTITALATGVVYEMHGFWNYHMPINSSSTIYFILDATAPQISILSINNKTYEVSNIPLDFIVNEAVSQIWYVLDGQDNVTTSGNTTLTNLAVGEHTLAVHVCDIAGNVGSSGTVKFKVVEKMELETSKIPAGTATVAIGTVVAGAGWILIHRKRHREGGRT